MYAKLETLRNVRAPITFLFCAGFEHRAVRAPRLLTKLGIEARRVLALTYSGDRHKKNTQTVISCARELCSPRCIRKTDVRDYDAIREYIKQLDPTEDLVVFDITGLSRVPMMVTLSALYDARLRFFLIYTEAAEYYPKRAEFARFARGKDIHSAFLKLSEFERNRTMYSSNCAVEEVPGFAGRLLPNYPLMLITFLTFKRGRVSAILQTYEANVRVLIKGVPVRGDLKWRAQAIEVPNFDLIQNDTVHELETLDWSKTYQFLSQVYEDQNSKYRFNFLMAPLGSKMQTVGAWLFAKERREVKVITSTPKEIYHEKYSIGFKETFLVTNIPNLAHASEKVASA